MKIHFRPPPVIVPPAPPPKPMPTALELEMQAEELSKTSRQHKAHLKRMFGSRSHLDDDEEDAEGDHHPHRNFDFLA